MTRDLTVNRAAGGDRRLARMEKVHGGKRLIA
jgi:hypothetical protein